MTQMISIAQPPPRRFPADIAMRLIARAPANDICQNATALPSDGLVTPGTIIDATTETEFRACLMDSVGVWYTFIGTGNSMTVSTCNNLTSFDTVLAVYNDGCVTETCFGEASDDLACADNSLASGFTFDSTVDQQYTVQVNNANPNEVEGDFGISVIDHI
jgi:hypothetical protein